MKKQRIFAAALAGLCAVSTMGVSAFAADETIETSGAKSYKISAGFQAPTIDVTVPEEVLGVINPYKIPVVIDGVTFEAEGIASPKYTITNNSTQVGINVKATYSAEGLDGVVATEAEATTGNTAKKKLAFVTLNATSPLDIGDLDNCTAATGNITPLIMATTENTTPAMLLRLNTKTAGNNEGDFWIGGAVIEEPAEKWAASDRLSINVVLDINPFNTGAAGGGVTSVDTTLSALSVSGGASINFVDGTTTYTSGASQYAPVIITATANNAADTTISATVNGAADANILTTTGSTLAAGTATVVITVSENADPTNKTEYTITFTVT